MAAYMRARPKHPSGHPQPEGNYRNLPIIRVPRDGYLTPGLRNDRRVEVIGFHVNRTEDEYDD